MKAQKRISQLVVSDSGSEFKGSDVRQWLQPCVYVFLRDGRALYVGYSSTGIARALAKRHLSGWKAREECDQLKVWTCRNAKDAKELEDILIGRLQPLYNTNGLRTHLNALLGLRRYAHSS